MSESQNVLRPFLPFTPSPDRDSEPYWAALAQGEFKLQQCRECAAWRWPARAICNRCHSFESDWRANAGRGRVESWVRTHQAFAKALKAAVPYRVVQIRLDVQADLLLIGSWLSPREPIYQEAVTLEIVQGLDGFHLPCWKPNNDA